MNKNRKFFIYFLFFLNIDVNLQNVFFIQALNEIKLSEI